MDEIKELENIESMPESLEENATEIATTIEVS